MRRRADDGRELALEIDLDAAARNDNRIVVADEHRRRLQEQIRVVTRVAWLALPDARGRHGCRRGRGRSSAAGRFRRRRSAPWRMFLRDAAFLLTVFSTI